MDRIRQLPPEVISKIAAGEVIERPASVVKELLENAVDAGSTHIDVDIEQGGTELIRVVDNGCGIHADDLPLTFATHATSKLANADDLFRIGTLGFRGEALASISGVAQVRLQSRLAGEATGAEITCHGSQVSAVRPWNSAPGTRIEVRNLFYNTPVRRKFLRTIGTEMGHIAEVFTRLGLARCRLHLTLRHNGKTVYELPGRDDLAPAIGLLDRIGVFFGTEVRDQLHVLEAEQMPVTLRGYVADPACERGNAKLQYLFVNGRWIRDRSLSHALQEAYRGLLMTGRYPVAFLFLELPPDLVDVNVHPTKAEVRFRDAQMVYHLVHAGIRNRLRAENLIGRLQPPLAGTHPQSSADQAAEATRWQQAPWSLSAPPPPAPGLPFASATAHNQPVTTSPVPGSTAPGENGDIPDAAEGPSEQVPHGKDEGGSSPSSFILHPSSFPTSSFPKPKAIQLHDAYLVVETPEGMLVIDQHALHERILFEQLQERVRTGSLETQQLLVPEPVDLTAEQAARVLEQREALAELGLGVEDFGGGTVLLTSYPALLSRQPPGAILQAVVDHLVNKGRIPNRQQLLNDLLSVMACRAAVKAGDRLTEEEINSLVAEPNLTVDIHHCPHGRPTSLLFSRQELDRQFGRI